MCPVPRCNLQSRGSPSYVSRCDGFLCYCASRLRCCSWAPPHVTPHITVHLLAPCLVYRKCRVHTPSQILTVLTQTVVDYLSSSQKPVAVPLPSASLPVHFVLNLPTIRCCRIGVNI